MPPYKNVLIIGAGGSLGAPVLGAFAARPEYNLTILTRHDSSATFPPGLPVVRANYVSLNSLVSAFKGQDAIVSLIGGHALSSQNFFIDAAIRAGVKRFIPSEFGPNSRNEEFVKYNDVVLPVRAGIVDYLKYKEGQGDGKLSWTSVICGGFFDWMLYSGMLGFDLKNRSVELIDNGTSVCTFTSLSTVGETVVKILDHADETRNQYVFTTSFQVSPRDVLEVIEKVDGKKWSVHYTTCEEVIAKGRKRLDNGDFAGIMDLTRGAAFGRLALGDESKNGFWNQRLELVEDEDIEEAVRDVLRGQGMLSE
jgi:nucleoside-diphosphate-sugar epimerase